jgi:hypothetical protein
MCSGSVFTIRLELVLTQCVYDLMLYTCIIN